MESFMICSPQQIKKDEMDGASAGKKINPQKIFGEQT
jgi:hypothetical protein